MLCFGLQNSTTVYPHYVVVRATEQHHRVPSLCCGSGYRTAPPCTLTMLWFGLQNSTIVYPHYVVVRATEQHHRVPSLCCGSCYRTVPPCTLAMLFVLQNSPTVYPHYVLVRTTEFRATVYPHHELQNRAVASSADVEGLFQLWVAFIHASGNRLEMKTKLN